MILDLQRFLDTARPVWKALEAALVQLENDPDPQWDLARTESFYRLYQQTSAHLSEVRHLTAERELREYLEQLVARSYARIYVRSRRQEGRRWWSWFTAVFPATVRKHGRALALSGGLFVLGSLFGAAALQIDPAAKGALLPFGHGQTTPTERVKREMADRGQKISQARGRFSAELMTHNTRISFLTLGLGMTFGLGTVVMLFYNGVILGAVAFDYIADGQGLFLVGWILPHGSVEIPAILLAGQAGLVLGHALIGWGTRTPRRLRLRAILPDLVVLAGGIAVLLVWAGIVESFFSQYHEPVVPYALKIAFGVVELCALSLFLARGGANESSL
ncbi:MAG TPA: stage II sporulation protein M [Bryobacteraceae bacterium]|nr:stage II sporulation protein M [Bryobacteraceae bacterium]